MIFQFYDSSALVKLFVNEQRSEELRYLYRYANRRVVSRLALVEVHSAIARLERENFFTLAEASSARDALLYEAPRLEMIELRPDIVSTAQSLLAKHSLRSLDAIQLASALSVADAGMTFVSADSRLLRVAAAEGLALSALDSSIDV